MGIDSVGSATPSYKPQVTEAPAPAPVAPSAATGTTGTVAPKPTEGFDDPKKKPMSVSGRYAAPTTTIPEREDLKELVANQRSFGSANVMTMNAQATREIDPKAPVNFMTPEGKKRLVEDSSQINPISRKAGNADTCCGGASVANALVLSAKTPAEAKANADALRTTAKKNAVPIKPDEEKALQAMSRGSMSANDMSNLQQLSQRVVKADSDGQGVSDVGNMAKAVSQIRGNGGLKGADNVEFHNTRLPPPGQANHWTVSVDGKHASSLNPNGYHGAAVNNGTPDWMKRTSDNEDWRGGIKIKNNTSPSEMDISYRHTDSNGKDVPNEMHQVKVTDLDKYGGYDGVTEMNEKLSNSTSRQVPFQDD